MIHTPGPWKLNEDLERWISCNLPSEHAEKVVCVFDVDCEENYEANARLITAAPDLLEALEDAVEITKESHAVEMQNDHFGDEYCSTCNFLKRAESAITKATTI